jgi:hypothetical protein
VINEEQNVELQLWILTMYGFLVLEMSC